MTDFLKQLETEPGKIHGIPFDIIDRLFLKPVTGDKYQGRNMMLVAWDLTNWQINSLTPSGKIKGFKQQPRRVQEGTLLLIESDTGIMAGALILRDKEGPTVKGYEVHPEYGGDFSALYQIVGRNVSDLKTNMVYRDSDEGKRGPHQPMGEFYLIPRRSDGRELLAGMFANTNSMSPRDHIIAYVAFRKKAEIVLSRR